MEKSSNLRSIIHDYGSELKIVIPGRWRWLYAIALTIICAFWVEGEFVLLFGIVKKMNNPNYFGDNLLLAFLMIGISVAVAWIFRYLWWRVLGNEIITITQNSLTITRRLIFFRQAKSYDLDEIKNLRWFPEMLRSHWWGMETPPFGKPDHNICFRYQLYPVRFGNGIDLDEALDIIQLIKDKTQRTFA